MKNLRTKTRVTFFLSVITGLLLPRLSTAQNSGLQYCTITATGTGKTTGDIVAMTIYNPSDKEVKGSLGPYFIPSGGGYQPYITMEKVPVEVAAGKTVYITLKGFCADITKPAASEKDNFKPINEWIKIDETNTAKPAPFPININPDTKPELAAPYYLGALESIIRTYEGMKEQGNIITPFSAAPEKEREAVIQQTFWIYTSNLRQQPYTKEQFSTRTYQQYEEKTNIKPIPLPTNQKQQLDKGIDNFWNTFQAVGTAAKVLNVPSKPDDGFRPPISGPEVTPCTCTKCELVTPMKIIDDETGKEITTDSVPWMLNKLRFEPPVVKCDCPEKCDPYTSAMIRFTPHYKYYNQSSSLWSWDAFTSMRAWDPGYIEFESKYRCECAGRPCGNGTELRKIYFTEKNNCCDSIRKKNNGALNFNFKGGYATINDNQFSIHSTECGDQFFDFGFNLEVIFCNLSDDQVFSELITMAQSSLSKGNLKEFHSTRNVSMGGVSTDPNMQRFYGFSFSKEVNGKEMSVFISIDKERCVFDISIFCNGKLYEFSAPPYLSPVQLETWANSLTAPTSGQSWVNAMLILSHLARADEHNQSGIYQNALQVYLAKILNQVTTLLSDPKYKQLTGQLEALRQAVIECHATGDFKLLDNVMDKMIPVLNAVYN